MDWQTDQADFLSSFKKIAKGSLADLLDLQSEAQLSCFFELAPIQDSFRFRARHVGLKAALLLIDEKGELQTDRLKELRGQLESGFFSLGPKREADALIFAHLKHSLKLLEEEREVWLSIKKFSLPVCHKRAEEIIRETLWPEPIRNIQTHHVRRAAVASWLTLLRQTTGSCFATAPAILIQREPIPFFNDLYELLSIGQLKRTVSGQQFAVPMCPSIGSAELVKPIVSRERLGFSPGLIGALSHANMLPVGEPIGVKARYLQEAIEELPSVKNPEQVLYDLTLKAAGLTDEEVKDEEYLARIQMGPMIAREGAVYYQRPSLRAQKVAEWKKRLKGAKLAFLAMTECSLLRVWEYTLASFCDVKTEFAKWNLYVSLGMHPNDKGGVADFLYQKIDAKLQEVNHRIETLQRQYEQAVYTIRSLESLLHQAGEAGRYELQGQMAGAVHEAEMVLNERDRLGKEAEALADFFSDLLQYFDKKLQEYFQEVFDPSVSQADEHFIEDSPAGFRLLYKHGRVDASSWEWIYDENGFIQALRAFFSAVEGEIEPPQALERGFFTHLTTALIQYIQEAPFLEGAKKRAESAGRKTPWDYVSGGTMQTLVQVYYSRSEPMTEKGVVPRSAMDLLRFLNQEKKLPNLLMHSPTHAFVLNLGDLPERAEEKAEENMKWAKKWKGGEEIQEYIGHALSEKLSPSLSPLFLHRFRQKPAAQTPGRLREYLIDALFAASKTQDCEAIVDGHLYEFGHLVPGEQIKEALTAILKPFGKGIGSRPISSISHSFMGPHLLHQTAKRILFDSLQSPFDSIDWDEKIALQIRRLGFASPHLLKFADTNWSGWFFGFVANPFKGGIELWRLNRIGTQGYPMADWRQWLSPENKTPWILLSRPQEYVAHVNKVGPRGLSPRIN